MGSAPSGSCDCTSGGSSNRAQLPPDARAVKRTELEAALPEACQRKKPRLNRIHSFNVQFRGVIDLCGGFNCAQRVCEAFTPVEGIHVSCDVNQEHVNIGLEQRSVVLDSGTQSSH